MTGMDGYWSDYFNLRDAMYYLSAHDLTDIKWMHEHVYEVKQAVSDNPERLTRMFYTSSYLCPKCYRFLFKAHVGERISVATPEGKHFLKSTFYCNKCDDLYSAANGKPLREGDYYYLTNKNEVKRTLETIEKWGIAPEDIRPGM